MATVSIGLLATASAQSIILPNFSSTTGLTLNSSATTTNSVSTDGTVLRLAAATSNDVGSVFTNTALNVATGFSTSFNFRLTSRGGSSDGTAIGADGIVFAVQRVGPAALGATGEGLGYLNIGSSVGIEFDTYLNSNRNDPSSNHVGVNLGGSVTSAVTANVSPDFDSAANNGAKWTAWVDYNGSLLEVRVAQNGIRPATALLSHALNLATTIGGDTAYVGFTAATGGALANHDLLSWAFSNSFFANGLTLYAWSGSGAWSETSRWNPAAIPGASDIALVSAGTATVDDARTIGALQLSGGAITGGGTLTLAGTGSVWSGGTLGGTGTLRIATGGLLEVVGSVDHVFSRADGNTTGGRTIENAGTVRWSGGNLLGGDGSTFINTASGLLVITGAGTFGHNLSGVSPSLTNAGILEKTSGAGGPTDIQVRFDSTGTVKAAAGTLKLSGGGTSSNIVIVGDGAKLQVDTANYTFNGGALSSTGAVGSGFIELTGATTTFRGTTGNAKLTLAGGNAIFDTSLSTAGKLTLASGIVSSANGGSAEVGSLDWSGGSLNAKVKSTGAATIAGGAKNFAGELTLAGNTTWDGSQINASGAAKIKNEAAKTFSANADGLIANSGTAVFTNTGTFEKTAGLGGVNATEVRARFESTGEIKATGGNLKLAGGGNSSNTVTIGNDAKLQIETGNFDFTGGALNSTATGALEINSAIATFNGTTGSANLAVNGTGTAKINGSHSTSGKLTLSGTGKLDGVNAASTATVGSLAWDGGDITTAVVASAGTTIGTGAAKKLYGGAQLNLSGATLWTADSIGTGGGAQIKNSGAFTTSFDGTIAHNIDTTRATFKNDGTFTKSNATTGTTEIQAIFESTAVTSSVNVDAGTLKLSGGGSSNKPVNLGGSAKLQIAGNNYTFGGGALNTTGTGEIEITGATAAFSGTSGSANLRVSTGGTAQFDGNHAGSGKLTLSAGTVSGTGTATIGSLEWTGGSVNAKVNSGGGTIGGSTKAIGTGGELTLTGNTAWDGSTISSGGSAKIRNETGATFTASADGKIAHDIDANRATFTNAGTFKKATGAGGGASTEIEAIFDSTAAGASVVVDAGNLKLSGGGTSSKPVSLATGTKLQIAGNDFAFTGGALNGTGTGAIEISGAIATFGGTTGSANLAVNGTGTAKINGSHSTSGKLTLSGTGKLDGVNTASTATVGSLAWDGGDITTAAIASAGTTIGAGAAKKIYGGAQLDLSGATQWTADSIGTGGSAQIKNSGAFTTSFDGTVAHDQGGVRATFKNDGTFTKSNATTGTTEIQAIFESTAVTSSVNVDAGTLKLSGGGSSNKPVNLGGSAKLQIAGNNYTFGGGALNTTGTGEIEITGATAAFSGTSGSANLRVSTGGTAQFDGNHAGSGKLTLSAGAVSGTGTATVGALEWTGGSVNAKVRSTANASITGTAKTIGSSGELTLAGTANTVTAELTNQGKFVKDSASTTDVTARFTNSGTVNVNSGTLRFSGGASNAAHSAVIVEAAAQLEIANDTILAANSELKGNGLARFVGGILDANGVVGIQNFDFNNGQLLGTNLFSGNLNWNGGNWNASAPGQTTTIDTMGVLNLRSSTGHNEFNFRNILNNGTVNWSSGTIRGGNGSTFVNVNRFNDLNTGANTIENPTAFGGTFTFTNNGRYEKTGAGTTTFAAEFTNNGALVVTAGEVVFSGLFTNNGRVQLGNGATAQFASPLTFGANAPLTGTGTINAPSVTAAGVVSPGVSPGTLTLTGDLTLLGTSEILVELAGTNKGVTYDFLSVGGTATLGSVANGYATLKVTFLDGYQSTVNDTNTFTVLTAAGGLNQTFANVSNGQRLFTIDGFGSFQVNYGVGSAFAANSVVLSNFAAMPIPEPSTWALLVTGLGIVAFFARRRR